MTRFQGKNVMVTGAGSGIGRATAIEFAFEGGNVAVIDVNEAGAQKTVALIEEQGGKAFALRCDVSDLESVTAMFDTLAERFDTLDVAVNNAGITYANTWFEETSLELYEKVMAVNVRGVFLCMQAELRRMKAQGYGAIVNTASLAAHEAQPMLSVYTASKHAVWGLTKTAAAEFARSNIQINAISPGAVETEMFETYFEGRDEERRALLDALPAGRGIKPREQARGILFLASPDAACFIGNTLNLDGGCVGVKM